MPRTDQTPDRTTSVQQFSGLVLEVGETALPAGAMVEQVNVTCEERGVLNVRRGLKPVSFENE